MGLPLGDFLGWMDQFKERLPLAELTSKLRELDIDLDALRPFMRFSPERYQRNLLREGPAYHALLLCWKNGQRSPIHDHRGSSCGMRILRGVATETLFARADNGLVFPVSSRQLPPDTVAGSQDDDIHQVSNLQPGSADLVTLHVYSPPLLVMGMYSLTEPHIAEYSDPIFQFAAGAGI
jgi:cysteine dioxygenase